MGSAALESKTTDVDGLTIHYTEAGEGAPVLLLHGWPTSSFLWRNVAPEIAKTNRVIAMDMPGYGGSSKPLDASYSFRFYDKVFDGFFENLGIEECSLAVHDIGGPLGIHWVCENPERVTKLALLNTLIFPELSWAVILFGAALKTPGARAWLTSPAGIRFAIHFGVADKSRLAPDTIEGTQAPFPDWPSRLGLIKAGTGLHPGGLKKIAGTLLTLKMPLRIIYGEKDKILPDVAKTMARVKEAMPEAEVTPLPDCGHFIQEERPAEIGQMLSEFFGAG